MIGNLNGGEQSCSEHESLVDKIYWVKYLNITNLKPDNNNSIKVTKVLSQRITDYKLWVTMIDIINTLSTSGRMRGRKMSSVAQVRNIALISSLF